MREAKRSVATEAAYLAAGRRHVRRARTVLASCDDPIDGFCRWLEAEDSVLLPATVRLYRQEVASAIRWLGQDRDPVLIEDAIKRTDVALRRRSGIPDVPRTASRKVTDATEEETKTVFRHLARRAQGRSNVDPVPLLALYIFFVPRVGCRPIEWLHAHVEGDKLVVQNAKFGNGRAGAPERRIGLKQFKPKVLQVAHLFADSVAPSVARYPTFAHWRNALAETLARACCDCGLRRLSLYSFRHTAIATWTRAGLAPWQVAALAGHATIATARRHYSQAGAGWEMRDGIVEPDPERVQALELAAAARSTGEEPVAEPGGEFDPFEMPTPRMQVRTPDPKAAAAWRAYADRLGNYRYSGVTSIGPPAPDEPADGPSEGPARRR